MGSKKITDRFAGWIAFAGGIASIISVVAAFFLPTPWPWPFIMVAVLQIIVIGSMVWVMVNAIRHNDKVRVKLDKAVDETNRLKSDLAYSKDVQSNMAKIVHNFCHQYRKIATEVFNSTPGDHFDHKRELKIFFMRMLSNIKEVFDVYTGNACAACVKLLSKDDVSTYLRDDISSRERSRADNSPSLVRSFDYRRNTAFRKILSGAIPAVYYSNDLLGEKDYENANPDWHKNYSATLVVPIRFVYDESTGKSSVLGFICVDNKGGGFDDVSVNILASFADLSFYIMNLIDTKMEH